MDSSLCVYIVKRQAAKITEPILDNCGLSLQLQASGSAAPEQNRAPLKLILRGQGPLLIAIKPKALAKCLQNEWMQENKHTKWWGHVHQRTFAPLDVL